MNNENSGNPTLRWIFWILAFIVLIIAINLGIKSYRVNHPKKVSEVKTESSIKAKVTTLPDRYTEYHLLKKGEVVRVIIPSGYKCDYFGGGKKYYHQAQNCEPELVGGGNCSTIKGNPYATYADIWYFNEEITVMCEFKKVN